MRYRKKTKQNKTKQKMKFVVLVVVRAEVDEEWMGWVPAKTSF